MFETHGKFTIGDSKAEDHDEPYAVMNTENGQVRWFDTLEQCRQFIGVEEAPGPKWSATPLDPDGNAIQAPAIVTAPDEAAAKEAGRSWFLFTGLFRVKEVHVKPA
jgi:hypothetical protein